MADSDILVTTRYTTEGYDQALKRADRIGQTMLKLSRDIGSLGRAFGNEFLTNVGNALGVVEDMIGAVSELSKSIKAVPALGSLVAGVGGAFIGSKIYDATIGKAQGTSTAQILDQLGQLIAAGFDTQKIVKDMQVKAQVAQIDANNSVFNFKESLAKNDPRVNFAISQILSGFSGFLGNTKFEPLAHGAQVVSSDQYKQQAVEQSFSNITSNLQAAVSYQDRLTSASKTFHAAELDRKMAVAKLDADIAARRIAAAQALAADLSKMDSTYYANRLKAAEQFGLESQRAEEDHQRQMRDLEKNHGRNLRKLAESRDALGIEDEMQNYEDQRAAAEEDYAIQQSRRNQDFANQMRDMETAFRQQRQERINAYNQQLTDIATYNAQQRDLIAQQMRDIAKAVMDAFTSAARGYTQSTSNMTSSTTNSANVTQNFNGSTITPQMVKDLTYSAVDEVFKAASR